MAFDAHGVHVKRLLLGIPNWIFTDLCGLGDGEFFRFEHGLTRLPDEQVHQILGVLDACQAIIDERPRGLKINWSDGRFHFHERFQPFWKTHAQN